jgi:proline dehydrogenase
LLGRALLWASEQHKVQHLVTEGRFTRPVVDRFVAGGRLDDAVEAIQRLNKEGIGGILDLLGEGVTDPSGASQAFDEYLNSVKCIVATGIDTTVSIKLTQLGLAFDKGQCIDYVRQLAAEAQAIGTYIEMDMEQSEYVEDTLDVYRVLKPDFDTIRLAMQVYLRRTPIDLEAMVKLRPRVRLVKGAYAEPDVVALQKDREIDAQYRFLTDWLFRSGDDPAIATHDSRLIEHARRSAARFGRDRSGFEIQMLYGIRHDLQRELAESGHRVRCYVPFGSAWYPYLMRRMAERPANLRFFLRALVRG